MKALPEACLNCGNNIPPNSIFCPNCGQRNRQAKLPLKVFLGDFFRDYVALDSKILRSVGRLIFRPGSLTREFNLGRRKKYVPPLRMYIFISFIYFFVLALSQKGNYNADDEWNAYYAPDDSLRIAGVAQIFDSLKTDPNQTAEELALLARLEEEIKEVDTRDMSDREVEINDAGEGASELEKYVENQLALLDSDPDRYVQSSFRAMSVAMFVLLPAFGLILFVLNYRRSKYYVEHLVHSVHFHTFIFTVLLFAILVNIATGWNGFGWLFGIGFIYLFLSLRVVYSQSYIKSFIKAILVVMTYSVLLAFAAIVVAIAALFIA